jgi:metal-sulfur cluster biosynthetic enzyme
MPPTESAVRDALRTVIDPELGINIVDLGLVYGVEVDADRVRIVMTMTSPTCPLGDYLKDLVETAVTEQLPDVRDVAVDLVTEPSWTADMMSDDAREQLDGGSKP